MQRGQRPVGRPEHGWPVTCQLVLPASSASPRMPCSLNPNGSLLLTTQRFQAKTASFQENPGELPYWPIDQAGPAGQGSRPRCCPSAPRV